MGNMIARMDLLERGWHHSQAQRQVVLNEVGSYDEDEANHIREYRKEKDDEEANNERGCHGSREDRDLDSLKT